ILNNMPQKAEEPLDDMVKEQIEEIINYLNEQTGRKFRTTHKSSIRIIRARINEGYTIDDFKGVVWRKSNAWLLDPKMVNYLRPETLFGPK
ncbi:conserved phage C-terminal domain-containing protein, partial [Streptococcus pneumoniae]